MPCLNRRAFLERFREGVPDAASVPLIHRNASSDEHHIAPTVRQGFRRVTLGSLQTTIALALLSHAVSGASARQYEIRLRWRNVKTNDNTTQYR